MLKTFQDYFFHFLEFQDHNPSKWLSWKVITEQQATGKLHLTSVVKVSRSRPSSHSLCGDKCDVWNIAKWCTWASLDDKNTEQSGVCSMFVQQVHMLMTDLGDNIEALIPFKEKAGGSDLCPWMLMMSWIQESEHQLKLTCVPSRSRRILICIGWHWSEN